MKPATPATVWIPDEPPVSPDAPRGTAEGHLRYEDVAQDGRIVLGGLPHSIGLAVWQKLFQHDEAARKLQRAGVIPILTRMVVVGTDTPVSVRKPVSFTGCFQMAHTVDAAGAPNRIVLNMWTHGEAPVGRTHGPPPEHAGELRPIGRVFAEHVFTRLFAPASERKVLALDVDGKPHVPPARYDWHEPAALLAPPPAAALLDDALAPDEVALAFGLMHTDSNQHVNSLVYPRLFEEAALRRFAARGQKTQVLARTLEVAYRKPCFAGDRVRVWLQAFSQAGTLGAIGAFFPEGVRPDDPRRAHAFARMTFS